jgi:hypothetical protein
MTPNLSLFQMLLGEDKYTCDLDVAGSYLLLHGQKDRERKFSLLTLNILHNTIALAFYLK